LTPFCQAIYVTAACFRSPAIASRYREGAQIRTSATSHFMFIVIFLR
jgi:hypothetical protein